MVRQRIRIRFRKEGDLRLISHRDLARLFERLFRRAGLRLGMSEGFHPKAKMSFPAPLGLGIAAHGEWMDFELAEEVDRQELAARLKACAPEGLVFEDVAMLGERDKKAKPQSMIYEMPIPTERSGAVQNSIAALSRAESHPIVREKGKPQLDLCEELKSVELTDGVLRFRLRVGPQRSARPREVLAALGVEDLENNGYFLTRTEVEINA